MLPLDTIAVPLAKVPTRWWCP